MSGSDTSWHTEGGSSNIGREARRLEGGRTQLPAGNLSMKDRRLIRTDYASQRRGFGKSLTIERGGKSGDAGREGNATGRNAKS